MKIVFRKDLICAAVTPLMSGVSLRSPFPAAEGILIEASSENPNQCVLTTYDIEKGVRVTVEAQVVEEGSAIIGAQRFGQVVRVMEGSEITLTVDDRHAATFESGRSSHNLTALPASDFPEIPRLTAPNGFVVGEKSLRALIAKSMHAMGVKDQRPVLNGMYLALSGGRISAVACDSYRMAVCSSEIETTGIAEEEGARDASFIVPNRSVNELYKLLSDKEDAKATVYTGRKTLVFAMEGVTFFTKLIEGEYVSYDRIIIRNHRVTVRVDREDLIGALEHAALITEESVQGNVRSHVQVKIEGPTLRISAVSGTGRAYDELSVEHEGEDLTIAFNNRYLMDSLRACTADRVRLSLSAPLTSINIEPDEEDGKTEELFYLLPVRMKE